MTWQTKWTPELRERLLEMRKAGRAFHEIARELKCSEGAVRKAFNYAYPSLSGVFRVTPGPRRKTYHVHPPVARPEVSQLAEIQRRKRHEAQERQSITGQIFGDPPPGFSALDRRRP